MRLTRSRFLPYIALVVVVAIGYGLYAINARYVPENSGGKKFLVYWTATRRFLEEGKSPYSREVQEEIRTSGEEWPDPPQDDDLAILFPLYSMVVFLPFAMIEDYNTARIAWMTILEVALIATAILSVRIIRWRAVPGTLAAYFIVAVFGVHSILALIEGNVIFLVGLEIALAVFMLRQNLDEAAALLLALAAVDPPAVLLFIVFVLYWGIAHRRWRFVLWFFGSIILLSVAAMFFLQGWPSQYYELIAEHIQPLTLGSLSEAFASWWPGMGAKIGQVLTVLLAIIILLEWWLYRQAQDFGWFLWTGGLTLLLSQWIGISLTPNRLVILLLPLALVFSVLEERWKKTGRAAIWIVTILMLGIPWGIHWLTAGELIFQVPASPVLLFPFPFLLLLGLYWIRWWTIRPKRTIFDELRARGEI